MVTIPSPNVVIFDLDGTLADVEQEIADKPANDGSAEVAHWREVAATHEANQKVMESVLRSAIEALANALGALRNVPQLATPAPPTPLQPPPPPPAQRQSLPRTSTATANQQRILDSLAWWASVGISAPSRAQVAFGAGYTVNGYFANTVSSLRTSGLVDYPQEGRLALTPKGRELAQQPQTPPTREHLHARVREKLSAGQARLFDTLLSAYPETLSNAQLAQESGYTVNGYFANTRSSLRTLQLLEYVPGGNVAAGWLFAI